MRIVRDPPKWTTAIRPGSRGNGCFATRSWPGGCLSPDRALLVIAGFGVCDALALGVAAHCVAFFLRDGVIGFGLFVRRRRHRILRLAGGLGVFLRLGQVR